MTLSQEMRWLTSVLAAGLVLAVLPGLAAEPKAVADTTPRTASPGYEAFAWGDNYFGQLGNGTSQDDSVPGAVSPGANSQSRWSVLSGGGTFSCGVAADGSAYCWGENDVGQLGNGTTISNGDDSLPAPVLNGANASGGWSFIDGGWNFNCGLGTDGQAYCWGRGTDGQLGDGSATDDSLPTAVVHGQKPAGQPWSSMSVGYGSVCGISGTAAYCWGANGSGELGNGSRSFSPTPSPQAVASNRAWASISVGTSHACAVDTGGSAFCWGQNGSGELGNGLQGSMDDSIPAPVLAGASSGTWTQISAGESTSCGISSDRQLYCWGDNSMGQLGQGGSSTDDTDIPILVSIPDPVVDVRVAELTVCATTATDVYCWGASNSGQTGTGSTASRVFTPTRVASPLFEGLVPRQLAVGSYQVLVLMGPPDNPTPSPAPVLPPSAPREVTAEAGDASASIGWSAPVTPGSFRVSHYLATSSPGGRTCLVNAPALTCEVTGLTNGVAYTFTVKALNGAGWSVPSDPSNAVIPRANAGPSVVITGSREGKRIAISGETKGFGMGGVLEPWLRLAGQSSYSRGATTILVSMDGTFEWSRRTGKRASVYVETPDGEVRSNTVVIPAR